MNSYTYARAFQVALIGIAVTGSATLARADIKDYEFQCAQCCDLRHETGYGAGRHGDDEDNHRTHAQHGTWNL